MSDVRGSATFRGAAESYDRLIGRYSPALARELIGAAGVAAGERALDVGCGPGALTSALVAALGADHVAAVDPSPSFVEACRRRNPGVRVELGAAEELPFLDGSFDRTLAQLVVNFMTDPVVGVGQMRRVTRSAGTVAAAVWDYAGEMTLLRSFWDAAAELDPGSRELDEALSMRFATPAQLYELWSTVGLGDVTVSPVVVSAQYDGFEDLWAPLEQGMGPAGAYTVRLGEPRRVALHDALRRRLGVGHTPFELSARAWVAVGRVV